MITNGYFHRPRTDRDRLLAVIELAEQRGWHHTHRHAQEQFWLLMTGRIAAAF